MREFLPRLCAALALAALLAQPSAAQIPSLPSTVGGVGGTVGGVVGGVGDTIHGAVGDARSDVQGLTRDAINTLRAARADAMNALRRQYPELVDTDRNGDAIIRNEVLAIAPSAAALAAAQARGFTRSQSVDGGDLGVQLVVLRAPTGLSTRRALETLRRLDPEGAYDFNHLYSNSSATPAPAAPLMEAADRNGGGGGPRVGLIDSGVDARHPALVGATIRQRGFAAAQALAAPHGTEVASLLAGEGNVRGAAPGASLYVADVYGGAPTGGGAAAIVAAFAWLAQERAPVINVSLVGPPNRALEAAVRASVARGIIVVAAVGNDGPNARPLYPASYPGVVGVTGVDARNRALPEAGRGAQVDFAAPGADIQAAAPGGGVQAVRGTSYAAPIVAGLLARRMSASDAGASARAQAELARVATDLGARGSDPVFGAGLVGADLRAQRVASH